MLKKFSRIFLSPVAGANVMLPYGVPFESLIFYIFPYVKFFDFIFTGGKCSKKFPEFFYIDGMVMGDGRTDGQAKSKKIMYFKHFSKTIRYFFLVVSCPPRRVFKTFSEKNSTTKMKSLVFVGKKRTIFFSNDFIIFMIKKPQILKMFQVLFNILF